MPGVVGYQSFVWGFYASWLHFDLVCLYRLTPNASDDISVFFCLLKAKEKKEHNGLPNLCSPCSPPIQDKTFFFFFHY